MKREKMQNKELRLAVLVSGGGTNLQAIIDSERAREQSPFRVSLVISSTKDAYALERARRFAIQSEITSPVSVLGSEKAKTATMEEKRLALSNAVFELCKKNDIDLIVLAGFLTVLTGPIIKAYENRIINMHPALLPKFGGRRHVGTSCSRSCACKWRNGIGLYRPPCRFGLRYRGNSRAKKSACFTR